jgi:hypothetical protein
MTQDARDILTTSDWPAGAALPVVKRQVSGEPPAGILVAYEINKLRDYLENRGTSYEPFHVYILNIWDLKSGFLPPQLKDVEKIPFNSLDALAKAGWEVD